MQGKRIARSRQERVIAGIAGGIAEYFNIDPLVVRLGFGLLALANGIGAVLYVILWFLVPNQDTTVSNTRSYVQENVNEIQSSIQQFFMWIRSKFQ
jgi:phage shock protein C